MVVTMTIMGIVMIIFTTGMSQMYTAEERTEATSDALSQITVAFGRLDKGVRYASAISLAGVGTAGGTTADPYVEYLTSYTGPKTCNELRLHVATKQLQQRSWLQSSTPLVLSTWTPSRWTPLASEVTAAVFTKTPAGITLNFQRLRIQLSVKSGNNSTATTKSSDITFTALNTSLSTPLTSDTACTEGRSVA
jgi:hypothetical protein